MSIDLSGRTVVVRVDMDKGAPKYGRPIGKTAAGEESPVAIGAPSTSSTPGNDVVAARAAFPASVSLCRMGSTRSAPSLVIALYCGAHATSGAAPHQLTR